ncbi:unnamed protein product [Owenia fusiformis]|uniref:Uncharacterized protein n=1 Tax=Owenia fusiformis TaxID=6347 RepID=A0A8J1Y0K3_OWEFU|nr:unnamed protein product [Owenia fusiformis]
MNSSVSSVESFILGDSKLENDLQNCTVYLVVDPQEDHEKLTHENELIYVVVVVTFYALTLMSLIGYQIRRSKRDGMELDYFEEYVQRKSMLTADKKAQKINMIRMIESQLSVASSRAAMTIPEEAEVDVDAEDVEEVAEENDNVNSRVFIV